MVTAEIHLWTYTSTWVDDSNVQEPVGFSTFSFIKLATAVSERTVSITQNFTRVSVNYKEMFRPVNYQLFNRWLAHFSFGNLENSANSSSLWLRLCGFTDFKLNLVDALLSFSRSSLSSAASAEGNTLWLLLHTAVDNCSFCARGFSFNITLQRFHTSGQPAAEFSQAVIRPKLSSKRDSVNSSRLHPTLKLRCELEVGFSAPVRTNSALVALMFGCFLPHSLKVHCYTTSLRIPEVEIAFLESSQWSEQIQKGSRFSTSI